MLTNICLANIRLKKVNRCLVSKRLTNTWLLLAPTVIIKTVGISILEDLLTIRGEDTVLSSLHSDYVQLCLAAKMLSLPLRFLDNDITAIADNEVSNSYTVNNS